MPGPADETGTATGQAVAAFAAQLPDAVDLESVQDDLAGAVRRALEPAHVWVWISQHGGGPRPLPGQQA